MIEHKIGEIVKVGGDRYETKEANGDSCFASKDCDFIGKGRKCEAPFLSVCLGTDRKDGKNIKYVKVKNVRR